jgi:hypothetical protein
MKSKTLLLSQKPVKVDKKIASHIKWLNDHDYTTIYSCSGHFPDPLYITFKDLNTLKLDKLLVALNRYSNIRLTHEGHNRYRFEIDGSHKIKLLKKIIRELKQLEPLKQIPLSFFG